MTPYSIGFALMFVALAAWEFRLLGRVLANVEDGTKRRVVNAIRFGQLAVYPALGWYLAGYVEN
jgi:hypothetical protein